MVIELACVVMVARLGSMFHYRCMKFTTPKGEQIGVTVFALWLSMAIFVKWLGQLTVISWCGLCRVFVALVSLATKRSRAC